MSIILGAAAYVLIGYLAFRVWLRLCPPLSGWYGNGGSIDMTHGWFVPAFNGRAVRKYEELNKREVPAGLPLEACLWISVTAWPGIAVVGTSGLICRAAQHIAKANISTVPPTENDLVLAEAEREVEGICSETPTR